MSIINNMLQDLDKRKGRTVGDAVAGEAVRAVKPQSQWSIGRNTVITMAVLSILVIGGLQLMPSPKTPVVAAPPPTLVAQAPAAAPASVASAVPVLAPVSANAAPAAAGSASTSSPAVPAAAKTAAAAESVPRPNVPLAIPSAGAPKFAAATEAPPPAHAAARPNRAASPERAAPLADGAEASARPTAPRISATSSKTYGSTQTAANLLSEAKLLDQQGRLEEAKLPLQRALALNPIDTAARQMLIRLHIDTGKIEEARQLLADGQGLHPEQTDFTLALARLRVETGDVQGAIQLLEAGLASARDEPRYNALLAALLLRVKRHEDAVKHYLVALRTDPGNLIWLVGIGVALEGAGKPADAVQAYRRAEGLGNLTPDMSRFVNERLLNLPR